MTVLAIFGYGLVAFGPVGTLFVVTVARQAHEVIIVMSRYFDLSLFNTISLVYCVNEYL